MGKNLYGIELEFDSVKGFDSLKTKTKKRYRKLLGGYEEIIITHKNKFGALKGKLNNAIDDLGFEPEWEPHDVCLELKNKGPTEWNAAAKTKIRLLCERLKDPYFDLEIEPSYNGLHVHVDIRHLSVKEVKNLMLWVELMEPSFRGIIPRNRTLSFCSRTKFVNLNKNYNTVPELILNTYLRRGKNKFDELETFANEAMHRQRYHGVNFHSYLIRGSVEFRWFPSTLDPDEIIFYIDACCNLVNLAKQAPPSPKQMITSMNKLLKLKAI